ncbi:hypothetical protein [Thiomonas delicata]|uniref:hypothetical protein n=1 Tax=Thiomonas delicata TaxID=364030 RepID=UPI001140447C|nr:hypothetical protein [Thiomonas delicata]
MQKFRVTGHVVWPVRPNVDKTERVVEVGESRFIVSLEFPSVYFVDKELKLANSNWCQLSVSWRQPFSGTRNAARKWASSKDGSKVLIEKIERAQHAYVDVLKSEFHENYDVHCIRHFGPLDWPYVCVQFAGALVFKRIGSSLGAHFRSLRSSLDSLPDVCRRISFEQRTLQRAIDLAQCGYPTESVLLAAAVLDAFVQKFLRALMALRFIEEESAEQLLRNVMTKRMATYLDAVLKLASGHSLAEDEPGLFERLLKVNKQRNDAIHNGRELARADAYEACDMVHKVAMYLSLVNADVAPQLRAPKFFT